MMITNNRELVLDGLGYLWQGGGRARGKRPDTAKRQARAVYLRFFRGCKYEEVAQELHCSVERARQLAAGGLREIGDYLNRKYGKSVAFGA